MKKIALAAAALLATTAMPASAATITYTFTGTFSGVNGGPFNDVNARFTGIGDTNNTGTAFNLPGATSVALSSLTAVGIGNSVDVGTFNITSPSFFYIYGPGLIGEPSRRLGLGFDNSGVNALGLESTAFNGYSGLTSFSTTNASDYYRNASFNTDRGAVTITNFTGGSFGAAAAAAPGAVPEPATWGMMLLGFGMVGFGMRRRKSKVTTNVSFA